MVNPKGSATFPIVRNKDTARATAARVAAADAFALEVGRYLYETLSEASRKSMHGQAEWLNANGYYTRRGCMWSAKSVCRLYDRLKIIESLKKVRQP